MQPAQQNPQFVFHFWFHLPYVTLDKLLKLSDHQFISSSAEESVSTDPLQGGCGDQFDGTHLSPFPAQVRGGALFAEDLTGEMYKRRCFGHTESLLYFGIWALKTILPFE